MNRANKMIPYNDRLKGAIIGRFTGCALGAPVEMMELHRLIEFCNKTNQPFPPTYYFKTVPDPDSPRYLYGKGSDFTQQSMRYLSTDDDIAYTLLSLLMLEDKLDTLTTKDVAEYWLKYLPMECTFTSERTTLTNLKNNVPPEIAATINNNQTDFIGAAIRIDGYAYVYPGEPKKAVQLAYQDAYLSHRDDGLYSALYFTAVISLAFTSNDIVDTLYNALEFIPKDSNFYTQIRWALSVKDEVIDYQTAYDFVTKRFPNMQWAHAINNACLTVWGVILGQDHFDKGITQTVAMTYDNDCTAATVGSILGAYFGIEAIDPTWYLPWNNTILSYLNSIDSFQLDDVISRFHNVYLKLHST